MSSESDSEFNPLMEHERNEESFGVDIKDSSSKSEDNTDSIARDNSENLQEIKDVVY